MDASEAIIEFIPWIIAGGLIIPIAGIGGWIYTTRLRIKNGYPLDGAWGQAIHPKVAPEATERIKMLTSENAQLRAELGSVKDRLANIERIVTDGTLELDQQIEQLRGPQN